jgi:hypothetical protein
MHVHASYLCNNERASSGGCCAATKSKVHVRGEEPPLTEMLDDPIVQLLIERDNYSLAEVRGLLSAIATRLRSNCANTP